nr:ATP-dependent helicase [Treponema sp.]
MADIQSYLSVLNAEQKEAVEHEGSPLLILAGAGSGKTRVITTKIAYLISEKGIPAWNILAVTFTKKAAKEMSERAVKLDERAKDAQIRTFHSFGSWFLRRYSQEAGLDQNFTVYDEDDMLTLLLKAVPGLTRQAAGKAVHKISLAKDFCLTPDSKELYTIESDPDFPEIYDAYEKRLHSTGNVDFGDLIMLPVKILQQNEKIRAQMQYRFRVIMVDEYQDSNVAQFKLLQELSGLNEGSGTYVCVVGDDDQSIYRFRGAEVQNILNFQQYFPGTKLIRLERNYRSTAQILHAADCVVSKNESRLGKTLIAERGEGSKPVLAFCPTQEDETQFCADLIQEAHSQGCPYSDWAILYRMNAQSLGFESEFLRRKIPYTVVGSLKFYQREEIKDILAFLALIANPRDEIAFRRIINKPAHGIGEKTQDAVVDFAKQSLAGSLVEAAKSCAKSSSKKAGAALLEFADLMDSFTERIGIDMIEEAEEPADSAAAVQNDQNAPSDENTSRLSDFIDEVAEKSGLFEYHKSQDEISGTQKVANIQELENNALFYPCS